jgi:hypothetical protein
LGAVGRQMYPQHFFFYYVAQSQPFSSFMPFEEFACTRTTHSHSWGILFRKGTCTVVLVLL